MSRPTRSPHPFRKLIALLGGAAIILFCAGFDMAGPMSTLEVEGPVAESQRNLFYVTLWVTVFIFITVGGTLAYAQFRFRARATDDDNAPPPQTHGHPVVEVGLIIASTLLLVIIAIPTVRGIWYQEDTPDRENALVVKVTGYQWWFKFEYPDLGVVTANEMVIPTNRPVHLELRTIDVIHSFWVPKLAGKVDLMPNRANHMWLQANQPNYYWAQCAEYCGESHANMRFRVVSLDPADFDTWIQHQKTTARTVTASASGENPPDTPRARFVAAAPDDANLGMAGSESPFAYWQYKQAIPAPGAENAEEIARGRRLFAEKTCVACHTVRGHEGGGITGPDLTHFGARTTIAAGLLDNTPDNLHRWLEHPNEVKPGNIMWRTGYNDPTGNRLITFAEGDLEALVAYLHSLK